MQGPTQQDSKKILSPSPVPFHKPPHSNKRSSHGQTAVFAVYTFPGIELKVSVFPNK